MHGLRRREGVAEQVPACFLVMTNTLRRLQAQSRLPRLEQQMLWQQVLGVERIWLISHDTDPLPAEAVQRYQALEARRLQGEPMAYLLGWREFMGHRFTVTPAVLIPRPDTECLVEHALRMVADVPTPRILELGTGSGAIAVSLALARPDAQLWATDISDAALAVAQQNAQTLCGKVEFLRGSWYDALSASHSGVSAHFDLIVSNPPYIAADDTHLGQGDLRFEPRQALTDEANGLQDLRTIIQGASPWLRPGGQLWLEHGWQQAADVRELLHQAGFTAVSSQRDLAGIERLSGGTF